MDFQTSVKLPENKVMELSVSTSSVLFVLGPNGSGKSSLMAKIFRTHKESAKWVTAHRQTWLASNGLSITSSNKLSLEKIILNYNMQPDSQWMDRDATSRTQLPLYDLITADDALAREVAHAKTEEESQKKYNLYKYKYNLKKINRFLKMSNIKVSIKNEDGLLTAIKDNSAPYSIAQLSDGERNAVLISAVVLTAKENTLILVDEPERHLHRSIISPFLSLLFSERPDCAFVVSTHEVMLPIDNPQSKTLLVHNCIYETNSHPSPASVVPAWDAHLVESGADIDDDLKKEIMGRVEQFYLSKGMTPLEREITASTNRCTA